MRTGTRAGKRTGTSAGTRKEALTKAAIVAGVVVAGLVLLPVIEEIAVAGVLLLVVGACVTVFVLAVLWHAARRHPLVDVLIGVWLLRRHDRRARRAVDARSWPYRSPWAPPDPRTRSPW